MSQLRSESRTKTQLFAENKELRAQLVEAQQTLQAIRSGEVDALVISSSDGEKIYSLTGAERLYRVIVETMNEAALTVSLTGTILFCNRRFCELMDLPFERIMGRESTVFAMAGEKEKLTALIAQAEDRPIKRIALVAADGRTVPVQVSASPLNSDEESEESIVCLVWNGCSGVGTTPRPGRDCDGHQHATDERNRGDTSNQGTTTGYGDRGTFLVGPQSD
jgi:PAS domain S-box-containing protein